MFGRDRATAAVALLLTALAAGCATTTVRPKMPGQESWTDKVSSSVKSGTSKLAAAVKPKTEQETGNSLEPDKKPGPAVYVALAEMNERAGNIDQAEQQLRKALALEPNHLGALLAYAHLEDRQRNFTAAIRYYQKAVKKHSKNASAHNDMGLCYHRHGKLDEATLALKKAVTLDPSEKLYRDNLAAVLVDHNKVPEALEQLVEAHGQPVGHYNLAYLLMQKNDRAAALQHFQKAAQLDPTFNEARQWVAQLAGPPQQFAQPAAMVASRPPVAGNAPGTFVTDQRAPQQQYAGRPPQGATYPPQQAGPPRQY